MYQVISCLPPVPLPVAPRRLSHPPGPAPGPPRLARRPPFSPHRAGPLAIRPRPPALSSAARTRTAARRLRGPRAPAREGGGGGGGRGGGGVVEGEEEVVQARRPEEGVRRVEGVDALPTQQASRPLSVTKPERNVAKPDGNVTDRRGTWPIRDATTGTGPTWVGT